MNEQPLLSRVKYPKILPLEEALDILERPVYVFEKLDGANAQYFNYAGHVRSALRSADIMGSTRNSPMFHDIQTTLSKEYAHFMGDYHYSLSSILPPHLTVFGEWLAKPEVDFHTVVYPESLHNTFHIFDIYNTQTKRFIDPSYSSEEIRLFRSASLQVCVPLAQGRFSYEDLMQLLPGSQYAEGDKEGLVIKDYSTQRFAKFLNPAFSEVQKERTHLPEYCATRRIEKVIQRAREAGTSIGKGNVWTALLIDTREEVPTLNTEQFQKWFDQQWPIYAARKHGTN